MSRVLAGVAQSREAECPGFVALISHDTERIWVDSEPCTEVVVTER